MAQKFALTLLVFFLATSHLMSTDDSSADENAPSLIKLFEVDHQPQSDDEVWRSIALSPNGQRVVASDTFGRATIWDVSTGNKILSLDVGHPSWSPDGTYLAGINKDTITISDSETGEFLFKLEGHLDRVIDISWSPDGTKIVSLSRDTTIRIWDIQSESEIAQLGEAVSPEPDRSNYMSGRVAWSPDGASIAYISETYTLATIEVATPENINILQSSQVELFGLGVSLAWSPNSQMLVTSNFSWESGFDGGFLTIWSISEPIARNQLNLMRESNSADSVAWSQNGKYIIHAYGDIVIIDVVSGSSLVSVGKEYEPFIQINAASHNDYYATLTSDWFVFIETQSLVVWQLTDAE